MIPLLEAWKKSRDILGMNARNLDYLRPYNKKRAKRFADDKIACKRLLAKNELPVPLLIARIKTLDDLENFDWSKLPESFALKPNHGFGGEGILVVYGKKKNEEHTWIKADGSLIRVEDLKTHIRNILDGSFSLANMPDSAFFEERLKLLKLFKPYSWKGIPDIRVIVFNRVPVMAMLRLPTKESGGKANLQHGALGLGIDMANGTTTSAVQGFGGFARSIDCVPGTRLVLSGIRIPFWKEILRLAVEAQNISGLGYLGADIAIDRDRGPVFLELNARPGLSIQLANLDGLKGRLTRVSGLKVKTAEKGVRMGMDLFGGEIEEEIEEISGKKIIGTVEKVKLIGKNGKEIEVEAKIDTGADSTSIDTELARELGFGEVMNFFETIPKPENTENRSTLSALSAEYDQKYKHAHPDLSGVVFVYAPNGFTMRPKILISFFLHGAEVSSRVSIIERSRMQYPIIIGRRDLKKFLIDSNK
ncbi:MAG: ATP-dependent zinc protease [Candidatus Moraniibacteriota bacterium]|nr:MAG: ATP-dependent zinc protease [Candidatus Moranbacteria bacterium]